MIAAAGSGSEPLGVFLIVVALVVGVLLFIGGISGGDDS